MKNFAKIIILDKNIILANTNTTKNGVFRHNSVKTQKIPKVSDKPSGFFVYFV